MNKILEFLIDAIHGLSWCGYLGFRFLIIASVLISLNSQMLQFDKYQKIIILFGMFGYLIYPILERFNKK